uniref:zinc-binding dehydrogenase n=1 Tax=Candidatus Enterococcus willemsii TaxID=1857215 RepID=UPI00403F26F6
MQAVCKVKQGYDHVELIEIELPQVKDDLILIKVAFSGICGTDIHTFKGKYLTSRTPVVLGHEFSGKIEAIGDKVSKYKVGDRVTSETTFSVCGMCNYCQQKQYNLCPERSGLGTHQNGSMANYVLTREESVHQFPETVSYEAAALSEPLACGVYAMYQRTQLQANETIIIMGPGPIGLGMLQIAKHIGAFVVMTGITKDHERLRVAKEMGADYIVDTQQEDLAAVIKDITAGNGVDKVYDASGAISAIQLALPLIRRQGILVNVGIFPERMNLIDMELVIQREITVMGSRSQNPYDWEIVLNLLERNIFHIDSLVSQKYPLIKWREAFEQVSQGNQIKVLLEPNAGNF